MSAYEITEIEIVYKNPVAPQDMAQVKHSGGAFNVFIDEWNLDRLHLFAEAKLLCLTGAGRVLGIANLPSGGASGHVVDTRVAFMTALKANATSIYIAHNHPSNNLKPNDADKQMYLQLSEAAKLLNIQLLDYLILDYNGFYSFADDELIARVIHNDDYYFEKMLPF
ncbi:JAB domain-containing protein [Mucilaginibacter pedocola]|uniref:MPN domain-containing protein n=1 Tax=Mucilaginibacter pedocola TaxID=1792845 RepID=A0A1S9PML3_9SPHI|nr:JAB domain-containing protein [Mucilaginibacter pedocola]OOQ62202.1 hypothetical protein BC343_03935 [Mucilaginibacter pedocola]